jgi:hypothetical protein
MDMKLHWWKTYIKVFGDRVHRGIIGATKVSKDGEKYTKRRFT